MNPVIPKQVCDVISILNGLECWYASTGGAAGATFELAFGGKIRRAIPLHNPSHSQEFRQYEGEASLFVWCAWRLDSPDSTITSWDDEQTTIQNGLARLTGSRVLAVDIFPPGWDLDMRFDNGLRLHVFADHVPGDPSFDGNWELVTQNWLLAFGPGAKYTIEARPPQKKGNQKALG
jgi:hypothetical protein